MKYEEIKLNISNDKISNYKVFKGMKLYSEIFKSEDEKKLINKRVFVTPKGNYVYYERTDINWNYWSDKTRYDSSFELSDIKHNIVFEVSTELTKFTKYLGEEVVKKIMFKEKNGEIVEVLDIQYFLNSLFIRLSKFGILEVSVYEIRLYTFNGGIE